MAVRRRSYDQFCAVARALDLVGERWTLLLIRELMLGPKRFKDLLDGLPGIGTNLLADRLKEMEAAGIIARRVLPPPAGSSVYELTDRGRGLEPVVFALGAWGHQFMGMRKATDALRPGWIMVSLRATFHPEAVSRRERFEIRIDGEPFQVHVDRGEARTSQGSMPDPDAVLSMDRPALVGLLSQGLSPQAALRSGAVRVDGDQGAVQRFVNLFGWTHSTGHGRSVAERRRNKPARVTKVISR